jgi:hypothetical protein
MSLTENYADHADGWEKTGTAVGPVGGAQGVVSPASSPSTSNGALSQPLNAPMGCPSTWEGSRQVVGAG